MWIFYLVVALGFLGIGAGILLHGDARNRSGAAVFLSMGVCLAGLVLIPRLVG